MLILVAVLGFVVQIILIVRARPGFELLMLPAFLLTGIGALRAIHGKPGAPLVLKAAMLCTMLAFVIARI
jgi:hypothetical protein